MRVAFRMQLIKGKEAEYKRRHDELWPELRALLKANGIRDYYIFLQEETAGLFGVLDIDDPKALDNLPEHAVMKKWWDHMSDIMDTNPDKSPVSVPLKEVFYLP